MPTFYILVGLPGSGKSTFAKELSDRYDANIVSSDCLREELFGNESIQGDPQKVFSIAKERIVKNLNDGESVIFDATNVAAKNRTSFTREIKSRCPSVRIVCYVVLAPIKDCLYNNKNRERHVPEFVIINMAKRFQIPDKDKEFMDEIIYRNNYYSESLEQELWNSMIGYDQKSKYHKVDLCEHCLTAGQLAEERNSNDIVKVAAVYHDCGKRYCQTFGDNGEAHYYSHANVSAYEFLSHCYNSADVNNDFMVEVAQLIQHHMDPFDPGWDIAKTRKFDNNFADEVDELHELDIHSN